MLACEKRISNKTFNGAAGGLACKFQRTLTSTTGCKAWGPGSTVQRSTGLNNRRGKCDHCDRLLPKGQLPRALSSYLAPRALPFAHRPRHRPHPPRCCLALRRHRSVVGIAAFLFISSTPQISLAGSNATVTIRYPAGGRGPP